MTWIRPGLRWIVVGMIVATVAVSAAPAGAVVSSAYRAKLSVDNGTLFVEEFTQIQNQGVLLTLVPTSPAGSYFVRIVHGTNNGTTEANFPLGSGCARQPSTGNVEIILCSGVSQFNYRPLAGSCCEVAPVVLGAEGEIPMQSTVKLGSANDEFRLGPPNDGFANDVDGGTGTDKLSVKRSNPAVPGPVFHYTGDTLANDGFEGLPPMFLRGFELFNFQGSGPLSVQAGSEANTLNGSGFDDPLLAGGGGNDTVSGENGNDSVQGSSGNDVLHGNAGDDTMAGGSGDDTVIGDDGVDLMNGSVGNDLLQTRDAIKDQSIGCGDGTDRAEIDLKDPTPTNCETVERMAVKEVAAVAIKSVSRRGRVLAAALACPRRNVGACAGKLDAGGAAKSYSVRRGKRGTVRLANPHKRRVTVRSVEQGQFGLKTVTRVALRRRGR